MNNWGPIYSSLILKIIIAIFVLHMSFLQSILLSREFCIDLFNDNISIQFNDF